MEEPTEVIKGKRTHKATLSRAQPERTAESMRDNSGSKAANAAEKQAVMKYVS